MTQDINSAAAPAVKTPINPSTEQLVQAIMNLQGQITFLYKHFGLIDPSPGQSFDPRRTETGMGALVDPTKSSYV